MQRAASPAAKVLYVLLDARIGKPLAVFDEAALTARCAAASALAAVRSRLICLPRMPTYGRSVTSWSGTAMPKKPKALHTS